MCRVMLFNTEWLQLVSQIELEGLFTLLDQRNGGHGTGIALCYDKHAPVIYKGVEQDPAIAASLVYDEKDNPDLRHIIYHTRMASAANIVDEMCHPFSEEKILGLTLAHNGHIRSLAGSDTHSDTAIAFELITKYGLPLDFLNELSGVFVGVRNKVPFVVKASSYSELDLCYSPDMEAWCFCSNFYEYTGRFKKRFIIEKGLGTFEWQGKLNSRKIVKMIKDQWSREYTWSRQPSTSYTETVSPKGTNIISTPITNEVLKKRKVGNTTSWHTQNCQDWYCQGDCSIE